MTKKGIPDRWLAYKNVGERIAGTPFIAFKVPLGEKFFRLLRNCDRFTPGELMESNPGIKLIIDLTNTQRYYAPECVQRKGVNHYKLACPGCMIPAEDLISQFCDVVHDFLSSCPNGQDTLIGVHCTHGVNRTGFMICSFMIRHLLMHPTEAIRAFELARGHRIERQEYVEALMNQYAKSGTGRRRRTPFYGPPPTASDAIPDDAEGHGVQLYGFGTLSISVPTTTTGSWTITTESSRNPFKDDGAGGTKVNRGLEMEAGPSRKRSPNESFAPTRGYRKSKKDKRPKRNNGQSTSGTEGEDVRSDSSYGARDSGNSREERAYANRGQYHQREHRAYGRPSEKTSWSSPSHLDPPPPKHQPWHPPPPFPSSPPHVPERGFGHGVQRERDFGAASAAPRRGGVSSDSGGWGRGRGGGRGRGRGRSHSHSHGRGENSGSSLGGDRDWDRAGGRRRGEQFDQQKGRGWNRGRRQQNAHHHHHHSYSQGHE